MIATTIRNRMRSAMIKNLANLRSSLVVIIFASVFLYLSQHFQLTEIIGIGFIYFVASLSLQVVDFLFVAPFQQ